MRTALTVMHGVGTPADLPLPFALVVAGSAAVVLVTFLVAFRSWGGARWTHPRGLPLPRLTRLVDSPITRGILRAPVLALTVLTWLALWFGPDKVSNPFPGYLYVWVWVGLVPVSLLTGHSWSALHPLRTLLFWRRGIEQTHPDPRWGVLPATLALLAFGFLELVQPGRDTTAVLRWWAVAWLVWGLSGALVAGGRWLASADPFEAYASTVARLSPWQRIDGVLHLVNPLRHLASQQPPRGLWLLALVLLGTTAFDSMGSSVAWVERVQSSSAPPLLWPPVLWGLGGLIAVVGVAVLCYRIACRSLSLLADRSGLDASGLLAPSLVPIVVGYVVAHYTTLLVLEGQRVLITLSDPLGRGQNWFGTAEWGVDARMLDHPSLVAWLQVIGIVAGHVVGVLVAHDLAVRWLPREHRVSAQIPVLGVMVLFTCSGLMLLFGA